jgi:hypothetical protein
VVSEVAAVTEAHIHLGRAARTLEGVHYHLRPEAGRGPVVAILMRFKPKGVTVKGVLASGTITAADLTGPLKNEPMEGLIDHMAKGWAYVNVHVLQDLGNGNVFCCPDGPRGATRELP